MITGFFATGSDATINSTAVCPVGTFAVSGGYSASDNTDPVTVDAPLAGSPSTGWQASQTVSTFGSLTAFAVCEP